MPPFDSQTAQGAGVKFAEGDKTPTSGSASPRTAATTCEVPRGTMMRAPRRFTFHHNDRDATASICRPSVLRRRHDPPLRRLGKMSEHRPVRNLTRPIRATPRSRYSKITDLMPIAIHPDHFQVSDLFSGTAKFCGSNLFLTDKQIFHTEPLCGNQNCRIPKQS